MKIGIIGCGMISEQHLAAATRYPGSQVVGIADLDIARARAQAARFKVNQTFDDITGLLALKPDVVHVLTPPGLHESVTLKALEAGAHVYVEKPMATTVAACKRMASAALAANRQLCVGHNWVYSPAMMQAQDLLASGRAGDVVQAAASFNYDVRRNPNFGKDHWAKNLPGGLAEDLAVHPVALLMRLLGTPQRTFAVTRTGSPMPEGQTVDIRALLDAERGLGTMSVSLRARPDVVLLDIWCERMLLRLNISSMTLTTVRDLPFPRMIARGLSNIDIAGQLVGATASATWKLLRRKVDGSNGIVPLIHAYYSALESGRPAPVGPTEGMHAVSVLRSIWPAPEAAVLGAAV